jgi:subtilisin family serine protease
VIGSGRQIFMDALELVKLSTLMERSSGCAEIVVGLIDGPVALDHPDFDDADIRVTPRELRSSCTRNNSAACLHGTFVAGILSARRQCATPGICPKCSLLVRPIFPETVTATGNLPSATPEDLAVAIIETIRGGARIINLSAELAEPSVNAARMLEEAINYAAARSVIVVAAAGNQATLGSSVVTRHPWTIPVAGCDLRGQPIQESNFGHSIGRRGLTAPAVNVTSLGTEGNTRITGGTSVAAPFVTGTIALLYSVFPSAGAADVKTALKGARGARQHTIVQPVLDAAEAYRAMAELHAQRDIP